MEQIMRACWRLGFPGWQIAARLGFPIKIKIGVSHDVEAGVYFATSADIGLAVESDSLDGLFKEIHSAVPVLLEVSHTSIRKPKADIRFYDDIVAA